MLKDHLAILQAELKARGPELKPKEPQGVTWRTIERRLGQALKGRAQLLFRTPPRGRGSLGEYYLVSMVTNELLRDHVSPLDLARELGLIANHEEVL